MSADYPGKSELELVESKDRYERHQDEPKPSPKAIAVAAAKALTERLLEDLENDPAATLRKLEQASRLHRELLGICDGAVPSPRGRNGRRGLMMSNPGVFEGTDNDMDEDSEEGFPNAMGVTPLGVGTGDLTSSLLEQGVAALRGFMVDKQTAETAQAAHRLKTAKVRAYEVAVQAATTARERGDDAAADRYDAQAAKLMGEVDSGEGDYPVVVPDLDLEPSEPNLGEDEP